MTSTAESVCDAGQNMWRGKDLPSPPIPTAGVVYLRSCMIGRHWRHTTGHGSTKSAPATVRSRSHRGCLATTRNWRCGNFSGRVSVWSTVTDVSAKHSCSRCARGAVPWQAPGPGANEIPRLRALRSADMQEALSRSHSGIGDNTHIPLINKSVPTPSSSWPAAGQTHHQHRHIRSVGSGPSRYHRIVT